MVKRVHNLLIPFVGTVVAAFFVVSILSLPTTAAIPSQINYQGKLTTSGGNQVDNDDWCFKFEIYAAASGGSPLWTERWTSTTTQVTTVNGVFSVPLGSLGQADSLDDLDWSTGNQYLQIDLDADCNGSFEESFGTRKRFLSSSYAFNADKVNGLTATSTAAVANALLALDGQGNLNLYDKGVSSTRATSTYSTTTGSTYLGTTAGLNGTYISNWSELTPWTLAGNTLHPNATTTQIAIGTSTAQVSDKITVTGGSITQSPKHGLSNVTVVSDGGAITSSKPIVRGSYLYSAGGGQLRISDLSDPRSPRLISSSSLDNGQIDVEGKYLYASTQTNQSLSIPDLSDPRNPKTVSQKILFRQQCRCKKRR